MIRRIVKLFLFSTIAIMLFGCDKANKAFDDSSDAVDNAQKTIETAKKNNESSPVVIVKRGFYADTRPIDLDQPAWMNKHVSFKGQNAPFSFVVGQILRNTTAIVNYQVGVQADKPVSINYSGNIKGALDNLAMQADCDYTITGNQISWSAFVTKNLNISFMPGTSNYTVGNSGNQNSDRGDVTTISTLNDSQNSTMKGSLSVWDDIKTTLNNLKSKEGTVSVSESTTSVMIHDHPSNVRAIEDYIKQLNKEMSRQVELEVKVLQIELDNNHSYGIDWHLVQNTINTQIGLTGSSLDNLSLSGSGSTATPAALRLGGANSYAIIQALGIQGKLSIVTEPTVTTLNNQIAEVRITRDTSYLEEIDMTMATEGSSSTSLTPGVVTDGFTLYILPKIEGKKVFLQVSSAISTLKSIDSINNLGQENANITPESAANQDITTIQIPSLAEKRFNMRSAVNDKETLVVAGFKQLQNGTGTSSTFGSTLLGGRGSDSQNIETILLITPTIIEN